MRINKENGFDVDWLCSLDEKSIKALMPEYNLHWSRNENSPTYYRWKESGLTQKEFCKENGISVSEYKKSVNSEIYKIHKDQEKELEHRFVKFVSENKDEIFKAQVDVINRAKQKIEQRENEAKKKAELRRKKADEKYLESISQYTSGSEVAVSTIKAEQVDFINSLLKLGYKVKMTAPQMVFLFFDGDTKPTAEQMEKIIPRPELSCGTDDDTEEKRSRFFGSCEDRTFFDHLETTVKGVRIYCGWHLTGYSYPETGCYAPIL